MKDLGKAKTIIEWEIIRDIKAKTPKIDHKEYIWDFLEAERVISCHTIVFSIQTKLFISINQIGNDNFANLITY